MAFEISNSLMQSLTLTILAFFTNYTTQMTTAAAGPPIVVLELGSQGLGIPETDQFCPKRSKICPVTELTDELRKLLDTALSKHTKTETTVTATRQKRGLEFLQNFFSWCCNLASESEVGMLSPENALHLGTLNNETTSAFKIIAENNEKIHEFSQIANSSFQETANKINELSRYFEDNKKDDEANLMMVFQHIIHLYKFSMHQMQLTDFFNLKLACRASTLSPATIPVETILARLTSLNEHVSKDNFQLAIPLKQITDYYFLPHASCLFADTEITIKFKVPLIEKQKKWSIFEMTPIPFSFHDEICSLDLPKTVAISSKKELRVLEPTEKNLQFIPPHTPAPLSANLSTCIRSLLQPHYSLEILRARCTFACAKTRMMIFKETQDRTFYLANIQPDTAVLCENSTTSLNDHVGHPGSVKITLPCRCAVKEGEQISISAGYPCLLQDTPTTISHALPHAWIEVPDLGPHLINSAKFNITKIFNPNWHLSVPVLNLSSPAVSTQNWTVANPLPPLAHTITFFSSTSVSYFFMGLLAYIVFRNPFLLGITFQTVQLRTANALPQNAEEFFFYAGAGTIINAAIFIASLIAVLTVACRFGRRIATLENETQYLRDPTDQLSVRRILKGVLTIETGEQFDVMVLKIAHPAPQMPSLSITE